MRLLRVLGEYFLRTETSRWYSNQRIVAREHLPEDDNLNLHNSRLRNYTRESYLGQTFHLGIGAVLPNITLTATALNISNPRYIWLALAGELARVGAIAYHRMYRTPFLKSGYAKPEELEPEDSEGWKSNKAKSWEDEGEEWKQTGDD